MVKSYRVICFSDEIDVESNCATAEQALRIYESMRDCGAYHTGKLMDNWTGEIYCYFTYEEKDGGIQLTEWCAN